jgi:hypothetical protein
MWFNDFLRALADLVRAGAWPTVAVFLLWRYRDRLGDLIPRLRELFGAKFDPLPPGPQTLKPPDDPVAQLQALAPAQPVSQMPTAGGGNALPAVLASIRTPPVLEAEQMILNADEMKTITDPAIRQQALTTLAAALLIAGAFERIEGTIWASQLFLLQKLNGMQSGISRDQVKTQFFDMAAERFPGWFKNYSLDQYLGFLASFRLITDGPAVHITEYGREYLVWRVRQGQPMKVAG